MLQDAIEVFITCIKYKYTKKKMVVAFKFKKNMLYDILFSHFRAHTLRYEIPVF